MELVVRSWSPGSQSGDIPDLDMAAYVYVDGILSIFIPSNARMTLLASARHAYEDLSGRALI